VVKLRLRLVDKGGLGVAGLAVHQLYLHTRQARFKQPMKNISAVVPRERLEQQRFIVELLLRLVDKGGLGVAGLAVH